MRISALIIVAVLVVLAVVFSVFGFKLVPPGHEALRIGKGGDLEVYPAGIHLVTPGYSDFVLYPVGTLDYRTPESGSLAVLSETGEEFRVAFQLNLVAPPGQSREFYKRFGKDFDASISKLITEVAEIEAARLPRAAAGTGYEEAVGSSVSAELSSAGIEVKGFRLLPWGEDPVAGVSAKALRKLVVLGVDGGDWLNLAPMIASGDLPNFKKLVDKGATGPLRSMEPMLSPLLWTTMATGKYPEEHGILNFTVIDPETGNMVPITRYYRKADAVWNILGDYGRAACVVGWLATHPAEKVNGVVVTDKLGYLAYAPEDGGNRPSGSVYPENRLDEISQMVVRGTDISFEECTRLMHVSREEYEICRAADFDGKNPVNTLLFLFASAKTYRDVALHLLEEDRPDMLAVYFEWVDAVSHLFMLHAPPRLPDVDEADYRKFKDAVAQTYVFQDEILGQFMDRLDDQTLLMVVSDHGFKSGESRLKNRPEIWAGHAAAWHRINGILGLYGRGVKEGYKIAGASILDIAPTILALQGLPRAADMPGKILSDAFDAPLREALSTEEVATFQRDRGDETPASPPDDAASAATMKKLEALGYLTPDNADAHNNLGQRYKQRGEYLKAIEEYKKALVLRPDFHSVYNNIAVCYGKLKRYAEAEEALLKAIEIKPSDFYAMNNLAITYIETRRLNDALRMAQHTVETEPGYVNGRITLGSVFAMTGSLEEAEKEFERALALEPDNQQAAENLKRVRQQKKGTQR